MNTRIIRLFLCAFFGLVAVAHVEANDWTIMSPIEDGPDARWGHSLVTLPDGNVVMFGGEAEDHRLFNDLHFFGDEWSAKVSANDPPPARAFHKAWAVGDQMYVYGGRGESQLFDDLWRYDSTANMWADVTPDGERPSARYAHSTAQLPQGVTLIFGGNDGISDLLDFWYYNPAGNTFTELSECYLTYAHHTAHIVANFMFVFGRPNVVSAYDIDVGAWVYVPSGPPLSGRFASAVRRNRFGDDILTLYGGLDAAGVESAKVYEMNMQTGEMTERAETMPFPWIDGALISPREFGDPEPTGYHESSMSVMEPLSGTESSGVPIFFFGGQSGGQALDDTFLFDPRFTLSYSNGPGGSVIGTTPQTVEEWNDGEEVVAQPDAGAVFEAWSDGMATATRRDTNVTAHIHVEALFSSGGGVPISWYAQYDIEPEGEDTWADVDQRDPHGKSMTHRDEFVALTVPTNPASLFRVAETSPGPPCQVTPDPFSAMRAYTLQYRAALLDGDWMNVDGQINVPGGSEPLQDNDSGSASRFYRVLVDMME